MPPTPSAVLLPRPPAPEPRISNASTTVNVSTKPSTIDPSPYNVTKRRGRRSEPRYRIPAPTSRKNEGSSLGSGGGVRRSRRRARRQSRAAPRGSRTPGRGRRRPSPRPRRPRRRHGRAEEDAHALDHAARRVRRGELGRVVDDPRQQGALDGADQRQDPPRGRRPGRRERGRVREHGDGGDEARERQSRLREQEDVRAGTGLPAPTRSGRTWPPGSTGRARSLPPSRSRRPRRRTPSPR